MKNETWVKPEVRKAFEAKLVECLAVCQKHTKKEIPLPRIVFARLGTCAGICSATDAIFWINSDFLEDHYNEQLNDTLPHELAHYVDIFLFGIRYTPHTRRQIHHGDNWKLVMAWLGKPAADRCHTFNVEKAKLRVVTKPFRYTCGCPNFNHDITTRVHLKQQTKGGYKCKKCYRPITFIGTIVNGVFKSKGTPNTPTIDISNHRPDPVVLSEPKFKVVTKLVNGVLSNIRIPLDTAV